MSRNVVVFDLDDTLFAEASYVESGFRAVETWLESRIGHTRFAEVALKLFAEGRRGNIFDLALTSLGISDPAANVGEMVRVYREHRPSITLHDDAAWVLQELAPRYRLGLITDGYLVAQKNKVRALGLDSQIPAIIFSDEFGRAHWKPSETPYQKLVEKLGCLHSHCIYVSDNPAKDFITARRLGWHTVQIVRPNGEYSRIEVAQEYKPHVVIDSLFRLPAALERILE